MAVRLGRRCRYRVGIPAELEREVRIHTLRAWRGNLPDIRNSRQNRELRDRYRQGRHQLPVPLRRKSTLNADMPGLRGLPQPGQANTVAVQSISHHGSLLTNPNGRIPYSRYLGEPNQDYFKLPQQSAGWAFEHRFNNIFQFRQNMRFSNVDISLLALRDEGMLPNQRT